MPAREQIGIDVSMTENVSQAAGNAGQSIDRLRERIVALHGELNPETAREYFESMNQQAKERQQRMGYESGGGTLGLPAPNGAVAPAASGIGGAASTFGTLEDQEKGLAGPVFDGIGKALSAVGGPIAKLVATAVGAGMSMNKLSKMYERHIDEVMDLTMQLGEYGDTAIEQSQKFAETMARASEAGDKFGYRLEESMGVMSSLAERGAAPDDIAGLSEETLMYARGMGIDPRALAGLVGLGSRFGQEETLARIAGMIDHQGMSSAMAGEMVHAQQMIFGNALAHGSVKDLDEITKLQNMFAAGGALFQGEYGARRILHMDNIVRSAVDLSREEDAIIYGAARDIAPEGETAEETRMRMGSEGLTPELLDAVNARAVEMAGGNEIGHRNFLSGVFQVPLHVADILKSLLIDKAVAPTAPAIDVSDTANVELLRDEERIRNSLRLAGASFTELKSHIMEFLANSIVGIQKGLLSPEQVAERRQTIEDLDKMKLSELFERIFKIDPLEAASYGDMGGGRVPRQKSQHGNKGSTSSDELASDDKALHSTKATPEQRLEALNSVNRYVEAATADGDYSKSEQAVTLSVIEKLLGDILTAVKEPINVTVDMGPGAGP